MLERTVRNEIENAFPVWEMREKENLHAAGGATTNEVTESLLYPVPEPRKQAKPVAVCRLTSFQEVSETGHGATPHRWEFKQKNLKCMAQMLSFSNEIPMISGAGAASAEPASRWRVAGRGVRNRYTFMATQFPFF